MTYIKHKAPNKPCVRCLIREISNEQAAKIIDDYKNSTSPEDIAPPKQYEERLSICRDCKWLNTGVCIKSGAYVEARAYRLSKNCPVGLF